MFNLDTMNNEIVNKVEENNEQLEAAIIVNGSKIIQLQTVKTINVPL